MVFWLENVHLPTLQWARVRKKSKVSNLSQTCLGTSSYMIWPCMQSLSDLTARASVKWQCPSFSLWPHCCVDTMSFWTWTWTNFETLWLEGSAPYNLDWLSFYFSLTSTFHLGPSLERSNEVEFLSQKFVRVPKSKVDMETLWDWEMEKVWKVRLG